MSINPFIWVTEGGDLGTADWGCVPGHCASLCLQDACGGCATGGSGQWQKSTLEACTREALYKLTPLLFYDYLSIINKAYKMTLIRYRLVTESVW